MGTTTNIQCEICNDRGVIWTQTFPGAFTSSLCICHTPEYWAEQSNHTIAAFKAMIEEKRQQSGDQFGQMEHAGRQEHQLF